MNWRCLLSPLLAQFFVVSDNNGKSWTYGGRRQDVAL
jgi:hypothetical protein